MKKFTEEEKERHPQNSTDCKNFLDNEYEYSSLLAKAKALLKEWVNSYGSMNIALCKKSQNFLEEAKND